MTGKLACPPAEQIRDYAAGRLPHPSAELEEHLLHCEFCAQQTAELDLADTLVSALRNVRRTTPPLPSPEADLLQELMEACSALRGEQTDIMPAARSSDGVDAVGEVILQLSAAWSPAETTEELGRLGPYRILKLLGLGGMGAVFLAEDTQLHRPVALKLIRPQAAESPGTKERFLREARAAAALRHDHIVTIYQVGEENGVPFLAMEQLEGESLEDRLKRSARLPIADAVRIAREAAEGLAAAHGKGLIHRDIKPANIWLETGRDRVKLLDFGLARRNAGEQHVTASGVVVGTPAYMAPEQARGDAIDARTDLFSLGCVLYRMLTGKLPFAGKDLLATLHALANEEVVPPRTLRPEIPAALNELTLHLLQKSPAQRVGSAAEAAARLSNEALREVDVPPRQRGRAVWGGIAAALALCAVIVITIRNRDGSQSELSVKLPKGLGVESVKVVPDAAEDAKDPVPMKVEPIVPSGDVPSPTFTLDHLNPADIPGAERFAWQPRELVGVIGDHGLRQWDQVHQIRFHPSGDFFLAMAGHTPGACVMKDLRVVTQAMTDEVARSLGMFGFEFSSDGKRLFSGNRVFSVDRANPAEPRFRPEFDLPAGDIPLGLNDVAVHENRWLIGLSGTTEALAVWDVAAEPARFVKSVAISRRQRSSQLALSRDGHRLLEFGDGYSVQVWDIDWTNAAGPEFTLHEQTLPGGAAALSPDGTLVAVAMMDESKFALWDVSQTPFVQQQELLGRGGLEFAFSPEGNRLAVSVGLGVAIYERQDGQWRMHPQELREGVGAVISLAWSPDGRTLAAGEHSGAISVWDVASDPPQRTSPASAGSHLVSIDVSPDGGSLIAQTADNRAVLWKLDAAVPRRTLLNSGDPSRPATFTGDSKLVRIRGDVWDLRDAQPTVISDPIHELSRFEPGRQSLLLDQGESLWRQTWELTKRGRFVLSPPQRVWTSPAPAGNHDALDTLQFGPQRFATRQDNETIGVWSLAEPDRPLYELKHNIAARGLVLSADGTLLLAHTTDRDSILWDLEEQPPREYRLEGIRSVCPPVFSADGRRLVVADRAGLAIYDWLSKRELHRITYPGNVRQFVLHPDGKHLLTVNGNGTVYILRLGAGV